MQRFLFLNMVGEWIAIAANFTFAFSNTLFRKTEQHISPTFINAFRTTFGLLTFWLLAVILNLFQFVSQTPFDLVILLIISIIMGQVIGDTAYFKAQHELGVTKALAVSLTFPFFTFILSIVFLDRLFNWVLIPAAVLICIGVLLIGKTNQKEKQESQHSSNQSPIPQFNIKGLGWAILASLVWAVGIILTDFCMNQIDLIFSTGGESTILGNTIRFPIAVIFMWTWLGFENKGRKSVHTPTIKISIPKSTWLWLILGALIGTSLGAYLYAEAARTAGASFMALMTAACPLFSVPLNYFFNKEKISRIGLIGVLFSILGIVILFI